MVKNACFRAKAYGSLLKLGHCCVLFLGLLLSRSAQGIENIGLTNMVWLQGVEPNTNSPGFRNDGYLRLETVDDSYFVILSVDGTITNSESGLVEVNPGSGGGRLISADWINQGVVSINYYLDFSKPRLSFDQSGSFLVASYAQAFTDGNTGTFNQNAGDLTLDGLLRAKNLTFNYNGGRIQGIPHLVSSSLKLNPTATNPAAFVFNGAGSALLSDVPNGFSVTIQGNELDGDAWVTSTNGFANAGQLFLDSTNSPTGANLLVQNGYLVNQVTGTVSINPGPGGDSQRGISAHLVNNGAFSVNATANLSKDSGTVLQTGTFSIAAGYTVYFHGVGQTFEQKDGALNINGRMSFFGATFRYSGGLIQGTPILYNSGLGIAANVANPATFYLSGPNCRLETDVPAGQNVMLIPNGATGDSTLTHSGGFGNKGWLRLVAVDGPYDASVDAQSGSLTNSPGALMTAEFGSGGKRTVKGSLRNQGQLQIQGGATLTVARDFQQTGTGSLRLDLTTSTNGTSPAPLVVSSNALLDGNLEVRLPNNTIPKPGDQFPLIQAASRTGGFQQTTLPQLPNGLVWVLSYGSKSIDLTVLNTNAVAKLSLTLSSPQEAILLFTAPPGGAYVLQASTDLTSWTSLQTNQSFNGSFEIVDGGLAQFNRRFYRVMPLQ